ncbi:MAG: O-antigen ligase family protein [Spirochaetes bacterium]|nr:O-antigen ligase family protein [Spirochaetota bacterium]
MRTDRMAFAFGEFRRSSGIFVTPHDHSMFLGSAILLSDVMFKNKLIKFAMIAFLVSGVILTFNRSTWIGVFLAVFFYSRKYYNTWLRSKYSMIFVLSIVGFTVYNVYLSKLTEKFTQTDVYQERLSSDTGSQRLLLWHIGIEVIKENVFIGLGDKRNNPVYYKLMYEIGGKDWAMGLGGGIHNLAIEELVYKGIFSSVSLILFFVGLFRHISRKNKDKNIFYIAVFGYLVVYVTFQQFGASFVNSNNGMVALFYAAMVSAVYYKDIDLSEFSMMKKESPKEINAA